MLDTPDSIPGFVHPGRVARFHRIRSAVLAHLVAMLALILAIAIAAIAVTMEIAEAGGLKSVHDASGGVAYLVLLAPLILGMGGVIALFVSSSAPRS